MNIRSSLFTLPLILSGLLSAGTNVLAEEIRLPVPPKDLLKILPETPPEWQLVASNAKHLARTPPASSAYREYRHTPPPPPPGTPTPAPSTVKIEILDTAENSNISDYFASLGTAAGTRQVTVNSTPAIHLQAAGETDRLEALAHRRFLLRISIVGNEKIKAEDWMKAINLAALQRAGEKTASVNTSEEYTVVSEVVDELDPKRNRVQKIVKGVPAAPTEETSPQ